MPDALSGRGIGLSLLQTMIADIRDQYFRILPLRDPETDPLLAPQNCAVALIDYQAMQCGTVTTSSKEEINLNVVALCKFARAYAYCHRLNGGRGLERQ